MHLIKSYVKVLYVFYLNICFFFSSNQNSKKLSTDLIHLNAYIPNVIWLRHCFQVIILSFQLFIRLYTNAYQMIYLNLGNSFMNQHTIPFTASEASCGINMTK